ncbi:hypothetical protein SDRG_07866 [Saprolegnia diclina VS20]|uniref:Uncharacterized protein n=1 Tax=Saprolegnia diclina (strain VS20) TaxID=1156394 RepID=T0Q9I2_SAPDV|nr:hypothetical protein SDRG_07866 [Saprolegnia diclina VS20]EQC34539.1 hypothetical protein SDRG_07866 [Saprolegnia diclina VS20]|eukprot:XP_008611945.1 hypothetical protein SDRG_07866 [Saprolegnia diclina VS20]
MDDDVAEERLLETVQRDLTAHAAAVRVVLTRLAERILALEELVEGPLGKLPHVVDALDARVTAMGSSLEVAIDDTRSAIPDYSDRFEVLDKQVAGLAESAGDMHAVAMMQVSRIASETAGVKSLIGTLNEAQRRATVAIHDAIQGAVENIQIARGADKEEVMENIAVVQKTFAAQVEDIYKHVDDVMAKPPPVVVLQAAPEPPRPTTPIRRVEPVVIAFSPERPATPASTPTPAPTPTPTPAPTPTLKPTLTPKPVSRPATPATVEHEVESPEKKPVSVPPSSKIPVVIHARRREKETRPPASMTDLPPYALPPDMKHKIEHNVRATLDPPTPLPIPPVVAAPTTVLVPTHAPAIAATSLVLSHGTPDGPGVPGEFKAQLHACQSSVEMVCSLLEVTRSQVKMRQDESDAAMAREVHALRAKIKKVRDEFHHILPLLKPMLYDSDLLATPELELGHIPSLRTALLELSRNLNVVRQTRKHMSMDMRRTIDKIIDVINDAYHTTAAGPIDDMTVLARQVDRVARALAFGIQSTVGVLTTVDAVSTREVATAIESFSEILTEGLHDGSSAEMLRQHVSALTSELHEAKHELRAAILSLQHRLEEPRSSEKTLKAVHSRHEINDRGKAVLMLEHEVSALRAQMDARDETLRRLMQDLDGKADKRQLTRLLHPEVAELTKVRKLPHATKPKPKPLSTGVLRKAPALSALFVENSKAPDNESLARSSPVSRE